MHKKGAIDLVTDVDRDERHFRERVAATFPITSCSERNTGRRRTLTRPSVWVFDPIDGTTNFAHGVPIFSALLALKTDGVLRVGAVSDPNRDELFVAERGQGHGSTASGSMCPARRSYGRASRDGLSVSIQIDRADLLGLFARFITRSRAVRRLGWLDRCLLCCSGSHGRLLGGRPRRWDIAAGALILERQAAASRISDGAPFVLRTGRLLASNGHLHDDMLATIADHRTDRRRNRTD